MAQEPTGQPDRPLSLTAIRELESADAEVQITQRSDVHQLSLDLESTKSRVAFLAFVEFDLDDLILDDLDRGLYFDEISHPFPD